jgi:hypothetical protein
VKPAKPKSPKWAEMTPGQRITFVAKVVVSVLSFGFIFPTITAD